MAVFVLDSSAVVKRYVNESGTPWVNRIVDPGSGNQIYLLRIAGVEVTSAVARRARQGLTPAPAAASAIAQFRADFSTIYRIVEVTANLVELAMRLAEVHALRGYDAVQLAGPLEVNAAAMTVGTSVTFVSADVELNTVATAEGMLVLDPSSQP